MSAPDPRRGYFADYEIYAGGQAVAWGQIALACDAAAGDALEPAELLQRLRQAAAGQHGVEAGQVRLRHLCRL